MMRDDSHAASRTRWKCILIHGTGKVLSTSYSLCERALCPVLAYPPCLTSIHHRPATRASRPSSTMLQSWRTHRS